MPQVSHSLWAKIAPFLAFICALALIIVGLVVSFYLLIAGLVLGSIVLCVAWVKSKFFKKKPLDQNEGSGRIIEHEDINR